MLLSAKMEIANFDDLLLHYSQTQKSSVDNIELKIKSS